MPHEQTRKCVEKAKALIAEEDADRYYYASLQLRMGIEYLFYELLALHREELPDDITKSWQPRQIIDANLDCDPNADQDGNLWIAPTGPDGNPSGPGIHLQTKAPNKRLLSKHYHKLGFYLHAPVDLAPPQLPKWKSDLEKAIETLEEWRPGLAMSNIARFIKIECKCCNRLIKRNALSVEKSGEMRCPNPDCRAIHDVALKKDSVEFKLRQAIYDCPWCNTTNYISAARVKDGLEISCVECTKRVHLVQELSLKMLDTPPDPEKPSPVEIADNGG
jgi:hypothetical protein